HTPLPFAVVVPSSVAPSYSLIVVLASAVPLSVSVLSLVMPSPTVPLSVENDEMTGVDTKAVPTVTLSAVEARLGLPAASVAVAVELCGLLVHVPLALLHAPLPFAVVVPSSVALSYTLIVALASAVPVSVSTEALVRPSPMVPVSGENDEITGVVGANVST